jgi:tripeptide aminopeptidase
LLLLDVVSTVTSNLGFTHTVTERFLRYAAIDTQSDPASPTCPSTEKQKDLGRLLAGELQAMGIRDAHLDEHGYVYATIPANTVKQVPVICFCSHMDTSPDCTGKDVKPQIVKNYRGGDIMLPGDPTQIIRIADHPALFDQIGNDIVTSDGTTLLGADNKAGLAEIMDAARFLIDNPQIKHGAIKILFTPDEEIGRGVDKVDLKKLGAAFAYTIDGETAGNIEDETFSADAATITIEGVSPGFAKGKMEHAIKIAAAIVDRLPKQTCSPETTEGKQGFLHPIAIAGALEQTTLKFIVRDFTDQGLQEKEALLESIVKEVMKDFPRSTYRLETKRQYRNMKQVIDPLPCDHRLCDGGDPPRRPQAGENLDPRRHGRIAAIVHGIALPQHFRGRARVPLAAGMGQRAGHGESRADHRSSRDDLGRAGLRSTRLQEAEAVTIQIDAASATVFPFAKGARASRIDFAAAPRRSDGCPSSARLAGPISSKASTAASRPRPTATSSDRSHGSIAMSAKPASPRMR